MNAIVRKENEIFIASIIPDAKGNLVREMTYDKKSLSRWAGETVRFITVELNIIPRIEKINGRTLRIGGRAKGYRVIKNVHEFRHRADFNDILLDLEAFKIEDNKGNINYITDTPDKAVEIDWAPNGAAYSNPTPKPYKGSDGNEYNYINFFLFESENDNALAPLEEFKRQCQYLGIALTEAADDLDINLPG